MVRLSAVTRFIADGFREDAESLLHQFFEKRSFEFSDFADVWKKAKFSLIFMGRQSVDELREFTQECFGIALSYLTSTSSTYVKVGALYLLYGLYFKQPFEKYKVRIQFSQWYEVSALYDFGLKENHLCICFIIDKLVRSSAFHFVALPRQMGPFLTVASEPSYASDIQVESLSSALKEFVESNDLKKMSDLYETYKREKEKLQDPTTHSDLNLLLENKCLEISSEFEALVNMKGDDKSVSEKVGAIGEKRALLKQKQYEQSSFAEYMKRHSSKFLGSPNCENICNSADDGALPSTEALLDSEVSVRKKRIFRRKRKPKSERKKGRPKMITNEEAQIETAAKKVEKSESLADDSEFGDGFNFDIIAFMKKKPEGCIRRPKPRKSKFHFASDSDDEQLSKEFT